MGHKHTEGLVGDLEGGEKIGKGIEGLVGGELEEGQGWQMYGEVGGGLVGGWMEEFGS